MADPLCPTNRSREALAARLLLSLQLSDDGLAMKLSALRRQFPKDTEQDSQARLVAWLQESPPSGAAEGWTVTNPTRFEK